MHKKEDANEQKKVINDLAKRVVDTLRPEGLTICQAREVLRHAEDLLDDEPLKYVNDFDIESVLIRNEVSAEDAMKMR